MKIIHIHRRPVAGHHSIEGLFAALRAEMRRAGCRVDPLVVPYPSKGLIRRLLNGWHVRRRQGDVNHITGDDHYLALATRSDHTILTIHDCFALERLSGLKRAVLKLFWFDLPVRRAAVVTVISQETKRQLMRHIRVPANKIVVIPDSVSPAFRPCPRPFNSQRPQIMHLGTKPNKNLPRLIEVVRGLSCRLKIIGPLNESLRRQLSAAELDYVAVDSLSEAELVDAYRDCDLVSFVSTYEGFGLPILEANAVGRPVVTANISSMPEVAGDAACLVDPFDVDSIRNGLRRVIEDGAYRDELVQRGFENVKRFEAAAVADQYLSLYRLLGCESREMEPSAHASEVLSHA